MKRRPPNKRARRQDSIANENAVHEAIRQLIAANKDVNNPAIREITHLKERCVRDWMKTYTEDTQELN